MTDRPVTLAVDRVPGGASIRVVGSSDTAQEVAFSLEVAGGGNRSVHRSRASLVPGETVTLSTISVPAPCHAVLSVEPAGAPAYQQVADAD